ncbi:hypothetical protein [Helicobacter pylori]|nr:hypothetical protein [Helicobacter pylori]
MKGCLKSFLPIKLAGVCYTYVPCVRLAFFPYWALGLCLVGLWFCF